MKTALLYDFIVDKENKTIHIHREFRGPKSLVWKAWTTAELLNQWWAPAPYTLETKEMDFREGGRWIYAMVSPEGNKHYGIAKYITIKTEEYYSQRDGFCDENGIMNPDFPENNATNTFTEKNDEKGLRTEVYMHLTFDKLEDLQVNLDMGFKEGISVDFEQLDVLLEQWQK
ncbi:MAG: SRPBCC domain-containing protein [Pedobacter sp.]|nr:MAG: SRPBCC domain-containing protein [Pedobacter sp.]